MPKLTAQSEHKANVTPLFDLLFYRNNSGNEINKEIIPDYYFADDDFGFRNLSGLLCEC